MFKILVMQAQNGLSGDKAEFLINDRLSFMRFLRLGLSDRVPDAKTIWMFRERLTRAGAIDRLFRRFDDAIRAAGYIAMSGQFVDSTLVAAPKQRNTRDEKQTVKAGRSAHEIWEPRFTSPIQGACDSMCLHACWRRSWRRNPDCLTLRNDCSG